MIDPNQATVTASKTTTIITGGPVDTASLSEINRGIGAPGLAHNGIGTGLPHPGVGTGLVVPAGATTGLIQPAVGTAVQPDMAKHILESGVGTGPQPSANGIVQPGVGTGLGTGVGTGLGTGVGTGLGTGVGTGLGTGVGTGLGNGVGTFVFKPIEARLNHDHDLIGKMDPYCKIKIGWRKGKSHVAKKEGKYPVWAGDMISLKRKHGEQFAKLKVKDRDRLRPDDRVGECKIPLDEVVARGKVSQAYPLTKRGKPAGEILLEIEYYNHI